MRKNDEIIGLVQGVGSNSEGVVKIDNFVCFVPYALEGEKVRFKVLKVNKNIRKIMIGFFKGVIYCELR